MAQPAPAVFALPGSPAPHLPSTAAPAPAPAPTRTVPADSRRNGLLWRIRSATNTMYLVAILSHPSPELYPLPKHIDDALRASSTLLVEADLASMDRSTVVASAAEGIYPTTDSLWNHFSPETSKVIAAFCAAHERMCAAHDLAPQALGKWQPWMAALLTLNVPDLLAGTPVDSEMDRYFQSRARGRLRIREIDPLHDQLARVKQVPASALEESIVAIFRDADRAAELKSREVDQLQPLWLNGDMEEAEALVSRRMEESSPFEKRVLLEGQAHLAGAMTQWMHGSDRCFAAIDLDWIVGAEGVLRRLQQAGFQVQQILAPR